MDVFGKVVFILDISVLSSIDKHHLCKLSHQSLTFPISIIPLSKTAHIILLLMVQSGLIPHVGALKPRDFILVLTDGIGSTFPEVSLFPLLAVS